MKRLSAVVLVLVAFGACSGDDDAGGDQGGSSEAGWLEQWPGDQIDVGGQEVKVDEAERVVYVESCDTARELTAAGEPGGPYGPEGGEPGYGYICDK